MQFTILVLFNVVIWSIFLWLPAPSLKSERAAERTVCQQLAQQVSAGAATPFDYMATLSER